MGIKKQTGFTIVELLIVIVVIGILAAITIVTYGGVQDRARDTRRISDIKSIQEAIELHYLQTGSFPTVHTPAGSMSAWEASSLEPAGQFLRPLIDSGVTTSVPVDPVNNATAAGMGYTEETFTYAYYRYGAGSYGCGASRGAFYILGVLRTDQYGRNTHPDSPGFSCSGRDWQGDFSWVTGGYEN